MGGLNRTIYATPFDPATRECTAGATVVPFESMQQVRQIFGEPDTGGTRWAAYGETVYSDLLFNYLETSRDETPTITR